MKIMKWIIGALVLGALAYLWGPAIVAWAVGHRLASLALVLGVLFASTFLMTITGWFRGGAGLLGDVMGRWQQPVRDRGERVYVWFIQTCKEKCHFPRWKRSDAPTSGTALVPAEPTRRVVYEIRDPAGEHRPVNGKAKRQPVATWRLGLAACFRAAAFGAACFFQYMMFWFIIRDFMGFLAGNRALAFVLAGCAALGLLLLLHLAGQKVLSTWREGRVTGWLLVPLGLAVLEIYGWLYRLGLVAEIFADRLNPEAYVRFAALLDHARPWLIAMSVGLLLFVMIGEEWVTRAMRPFLDRIGRGESRRRDWSPVWSAIARFFGWIGRGIRLIIKAFAYGIACGVFLLSFLVFVPKMAAVGAVLAVLGILIVVLWLLSGSRRPGEIISELIEAAFWLPRLAVQWLGKRSALVRSLLAKDEEIASRKEHAHEDEEKGSSRKQERKARDVDEDRH